MVPPSIAFPRSAEHRLVAGVASGFAQRHGVDVFVVRLAIVVLCLVGGVGLLVYAGGYIVSTPPVAPAPPPVPHDLRRSVSVGLVTVGLALVMRSIGVWLGDPLMMPVLAVAGGVAVLRMRTTAEASGGAPTPFADVLAGRSARVRLVAGASLIALGILLLGVRRGIAGSIQFGAIAAALSIVGITVLVGPWLARAAQEVAEERRQRIRADERAAMAAHLHDSVLQTLALVQRNAHDPKRTVTLARQQERELRQWLYGRTEAPAATLATAVEEMATEVEGLYDVRIDAVCVGDAADEPTVRELVAALREACVNAAKHSGAPDVAVFVEVAGGRIEGFVRDRGVGFDPAAVDGDRRGIAESIERRIERIGGTSSIRTGPSGGTEVHVEVPFAPAGMGR
jgi:signal transduction histidine kinase/phage shock protein PspC (stress-responsive transcriptional regulator)